MSFISELKRRNVIRVAMAYAVAAWLIIQVVETILPAFGYGDAAIRYIVIILAIAFIPTLAFSWAFEITPEGLRREVDVVREHSITRFTGKKLDRIIMVLLAVALGYFAFDKFVLDPVEDVQIAESARQEGRSDALIESYGDRSIAVLPFVSMSNDPEQEYFADGLSDTLTHVLAQVSGLRVTAKTSSFYFKGRNMDVREIAGKLNVSNILEGSVQKSGNRVRITAQLIEAHSDTHLWSKIFDRDLGDIFTIQDEIAREVMKALEVTLLDTEEERMEQRYRPNLEAYEQLILGRHEMAARTADRLAIAEQHFKRAIELDPGYVLAYVGLAQTYRLQTSYGGLVLEESLELRQPLIDKALDLDSLSGEAQMVSAFLEYDRQLKTGGDVSRNWEEVVIGILELSPNYAEVHRLYSGLLTERSRFEEALVQIRLAAELDPMSAINQTALAGMTWDAGRVEEAFMLVRRNIERTPEFPNNYTMMAEFYASLGQLGKAQRWRQEARRRNPGNASEWMWECMGFLNLGDIHSAEQCSEQLAESHPEKIRGQALGIPLKVIGGEWNAAIAELESKLERLPGATPYQRILADMLAGQGDVGRAKVLMTEAYPGLLDDEVELELDPALLAASRNFAAILDANGEVQQRDVLLRALEDRIETMHRVRGIGYGIVDVYIHVMRGNRDRAIAALSEAIDQGWKITRPFPLDGNWWTLRQDWKLAGLRDDPEFIALMEELEAEVS